MLSNSVYADDKHVNKIKILHNHVARVTLRCKVRDKHVSAIYDELKWMSVRQRADYFTLTLIYRCVHGLAPDYLAHNIINSMKTHSYGTRSMSSTFELDAAELTGAGVLSGNTGQDCRTIFLAISSIPPVCRYLKRAFSTVCLIVKFPNFSVCKIPLPA